MTPCKEIYWRAWSRASEEEGCQAAMESQHHQMDGPHLREGQAYCPRPKEMEVRDRQRQSARHLVRYKGSTYNTLLIERLPLVTLGNRVLKEKQTYKIITSNCNRFQNEWGDCAEMCQVSKVGKQDTYG